MGMGRYTMTYGETVDAAVFRAGTHVGTVGSDQLSTISRTWRQFAVTESLQVRTNRPLPQCGPIRCRVENGMIAGLSCIGCQCLKPGAKLERSVAVAGATRRCRH